MNYRKYLTFLYFCTASCVSFINQENALLSPLLQSQSIFHPVAFYWIELEDKKKKKCTILMCLQLYNQFRFRALLQDIVDNIILMEEEEGEKKKRCIRYVYYIAIHTCKRYIYLMNCCTSTHAYIAFIQLSTTYCPLTICVYRHTG